MTAPVIAIDGPSGSGKGTVARAVATALGWHLLDSGALYRLAALAAERAGVALDDPAGLARVASGLDVRFRAGADGNERIELSGEDVTAAIRAKPARAPRRGSRWFRSCARRSWTSSARSAPPASVADGRDMGSVIFRRPS